MSSCTTSAATCRPILFSGEMVKAILDGRKTQTRRVIKPQPPYGIGLDFDPEDEYAYYYTRGDVGELRTIRNPYGQPADLLWVREQWKATGLFADMKPSKTSACGRFAYRADSVTLERDVSILWRPSIHMPRWASRITLEVTAVRVERVGEISLEDAAAEGDPRPLSASENDSVTWFQHLWDSINAKRGYSWDSNPWVWVVEFKRVEE